MKSTSNVQRPTSNIQPTKVLFAIIAAILLLAGFANGELAELKEAVQPLDEGLPQVAVIRLRKLLAGELLAADKKEVAAKLGEALLTAGEAEKALQVLQDPALQDLSAVPLWRAQALASLGRWSEALPLYQLVATQRDSPFRTTALFGQAEALRALHRSEEALQLFGFLFSDPQWSDRAQLRSVELLLDKRDVTGARRLLDKTRPAALSDKKEKRFLQGRIEAQLDHHERALELFQTILRSSEGTGRAVLIATLCAIADSNLRLGTPEAGDDALEDFVEHHPTDPELPVVFEKLDQLYRVERQPSSQELGRWANDSLQPRRSLAQWYLARSELRAGRRESALRLFAKLRAERAPWPALALGLFEFAQLELQEHRFDEALAILNGARALHPAPAWLDRITQLSGHAQYYSKHFEAAAQTFEQVAHASPAHARDSLFNASLAWLQLSDSARFLADAKELSQNGGDRLRKETKRRRKRSRAFCGNFHGTNARPKRGSRWPSWRFTALLRAPATLGNIWPPPEKASRARLSRNGPITSPSGSRTPLRTRIRQK